MINVLLFAGLQEKVGKNEISLEVDEISVNKLISYLREHEQNLELNNVMVAVNEEIVNNPEQLIRTGDIVALLPPVSGG